MTSPQSEISSESAVYNSQYYVEQQNQLLTNSVGGTNSASSASTDVDEWFFPQHEVKNEIWEKSHLTSNVTNIIFFLVQRSFRAPANYGPD